MSVFGSFYRSTVGKKIVMALSGLIMVGFVVSHMLGNLKVFGGIDPVTGMYKIDVYSQFLRHIASDLFGEAGFLWVARGVLLAALIAHVVSAIQLSIIHRRSKPIGYKVKAYTSSNAASRTLAYGGLFLLCFIIFHILHLTTGTLHFHGFHHGAVYANLFSGFQVWYVALFYVAAMLALSLHLFHGVWSMFQTMGLDTPHWNGLIRNTAKALAVILFLGFSAVPVGVLSGVLTPPIAVTQIAQHSHSEQVR